MSNARTWPWSTSELRTVLEAHEPTGAVEVASRREMLAVIDTLERPFDIDANPTHITASAIVIGPRGVLMHEHRRLHRWLQPGGHVDPGESPPVAAQRECLEETGLSVVHHRGQPTLVNLDAHDGGRGHRHFDLRYLFDGPDADPAPPAEESQLVRWFTLAQALEVADAGLAVALQRAQAIVDSGGVGAGTMGSGRIGP